MKEIKLELNGKVYAKKSVTVEDWMQSLEFSEQYAEANVLTDRAAGMAAVALVAQVLGVPAGEDTARCDLAQVMQAMRDINENIVESFSGTGKNAQGRSKASAGQ